MTKMTEDELAKLCALEWEESESYLGVIQKERSQALNYYNQEPFGNEEDGLSKYVSSDVRDTVEWIMPQLIDIFVGGDTPVVFEAENAEDAKQAEIESRYCQYVFDRENKGVLLAYTWFKDALLQKNGIIKAFWQDKECREREEYKNKSFQEYLLLLNDEEFEIDELSIFLNDVEYELEDFEKIVQASDPEMIVEMENKATFSIVGYRMAVIGKVEISNVPPENFMVQRHHNSILLKDAHYCAEVQEMIRSDLIEMGYEKEIVDNLPRGERIDALINEKNTRMKKEGGDFLAGEMSADPSRDTILVYDHYIRADFDGDGISELRFVRTAGNKGEYILENEEIDRVPYHAITPYINSYKFHGRSVADNVADLQRAKSMLWRNAFDNMAYSSIPRKIISGNVNTEDIMTFVMGGVIRKDAAATIENDRIPFVANEAFPMLDRMDMVRAERSGFSKDTMGLNPEALAQSTNLVGMSIMAQSQLLVKMIASVFAYTGFEDLMLHIRELVMKYESKEKIIDLAGEYVNTDPRSWRKQRSARVRVGIGFAGKQEEIALMNNLLTLQDKLMERQGGIDGALTNAKGVYNTIKRLVARMGVKDCNTYFTDPATYKAPPPAPTIAETQMNAAITKMNNDMTMSEADRALKQQQMEADKEFKFAELSQKERLEMAKINTDAEMKERELLYKYGKDAKDGYEAPRGRSKADNPKPRLSGVDQDAERDLPEKNDGDEAGGDQEKG